MDVLSKRASPRASTPQQPSHAILLEDELKELRNKIEVAEASAISLDAVLKVMNIVVLGVISLKLTSLSRCSDDLPIDVATTRDDGLERLSQATARGMVKPMAIRTRGPGRTGHRNLHTDKRPQKYHG